MIKSLFRFATATTAGQDAKKPNLTRAEPNCHGQLQCRGCNQVCRLFSQKDRCIRRDAAFTGSLGPYKIHQSFNELERCAEKCVACQVFRRALLLEQITDGDVQRLRSDGCQYPVYATLEVSPAATKLLISIEGSKTILKHAVVSCTRTNETKAPLQRERSRRSANTKELGKWIDDCHEKHLCTSRLRWSHQNPSWLIQILPDNQIRLVPGPTDGLVKYVALSYSWGDKNAMDPEEWKRIKKAGTMTKDGRVVPERLQPFSRTELPETMRDAIALCEKLGVYYVWIDSVCIPKGSDWNTEASTMHEVYGNAHFTLSACSSEKATDRLFRDRDAWLHRPRGCQLQGEWLSNEYMSLNEMRMRAPLSQRGWILQEERLSPRILFWCRQRTYWSCGEAHFVECSELGRPSDAAKEAWSPPQRFMEACRSDMVQLQHEWLDIVEAYTRRQLACAQDRFPALSGLAVRYYEAHNLEARVSEEYLAGLWRRNFASQLTWSIFPATSPDNNLQGHPQHLPSWSWASLPLGTPISMKREFKKAEAFELLEECRVRAGDEASAVEKRGRSVKTVTVCGRFRPFVHATSAQVPWNAILKNHDGTERFDFAQVPARHVHARNLQDGRVLTHEAHKEEVVGQLDYLLPEDESGREDHLKYGDEKCVMCLEVGESAMLLLKPREDGAQNVFRRVGVSVGYRPDFFDGFNVQTITLA